MVEKSPPGLEPVPSLPTASSLTTQAPWGTSDIHATFIIFNQNQIVENKKSTEPTDLDQRLREARVHGNSISMRIEDRYAYMFGTARFIQSKRKISLSLFYLFSHSSSSSHNYLSLILSNSQINFS
jgi:hypothetical protein